MNVKQERKERHICRGRFEETSRHGYYGQPEEIDVLEIICQRRNELVVNPVANG